MRFCGKLFISSLAPHISTGGLKDAAIGNTGDVKVSGENSGAIGSGNKININWGKKNDQRFTCHSKNTITCKFSQILLYYRSFLCLSPFRKSRSNRWRTTLWKLIYHWLHCHMRNNLSVCQQSTNENKSPFTVSWSLQVIFCLFVRRLICQHLSFLNKYFGIQPKYEL